MSLAAGMGRISERLAAPIVSAAPATSAGSAERRFAANWQLADAEWQSTFAERIQRFVAAAVSRIATPAGFDDYTRLAESRRREFRRAPLFEFALTLPTTNIPSDAPLLQINEDATVSPK